MVQNCPNLMLEAYSVRHIDRAESSGDLGTSVTSSDPTDFCTLTGFYALLSLAISLTTRRSHQTGAHSAIIVCAVQSRHSQHPCHIPEV